MLIVELIDSIHMVQSRRRPSARSSQCSIIFSETALPIEAKFVGPLVSYFCYKIKIVGEFVTSRLLSTHTYRLWNK